MKISFELNQSQKIALSIVATILVVSTLYFSSLWLGNPNFRKNLLGVKEENNSALIARLNAQTESLTQKVGLVDPAALIYDTISLKDFPVYPSGWVQRNFTPEERENKLIFESDNDPDNDGLSNKLEYFYGSNPKNKDSLCNGIQDGKICVGRNDKENIDANISPSTGLIMDPIKQIQIKKQDVSIIKEIQDSFENASREGVDFPQLYALSKKIDLSDEVNQIKINPVPNTRQNILSYFEFRTQIIKNIISGDELFDFSKIYSLNNVSELNELKDKYFNTLQRIIQTQPPETYSSVHKAYIYIFQKISDVVTFRIDTILNQTAENIENQEEAKKKAVEMIWSYQNLNIELRKLPNLTDDLNSAD